MDAETLVLLIATLAAGIGAGSFGLIMVRLNARHRRAVLAHSVALAELAKLNTAYAPRLQAPPPAAYEFVDAVSSKAKYDRYDLRKFFLGQLSTFEQEIQPKIDQRLFSWAAYQEYMMHRASLADAHLGKSSADEIGRSAFVRIERKQFDTMTLTSPYSPMHMRCAVTYTSPQGRNSYGRALDFSVEDMRRGLEELRTIRETRSTTHFLRQQERNRMTDRLRADVLRRDGYRCRMCGASSEDGIRLHVDHIVAVSNGGTTVTENLQTLCQACNLGKSNRF
ncbi:HNH endonuclease signature motif containing protein [Nocardioides panacisoli]|uniref:HNH nuclease domain-containing protein n=1 Tax=Nocardioides panacisoli TaxID=627624 RepID=A0ABP7HUJ3_9ACTN